MPNQMTHDSLPDFDAVAESRKWKEAVARETEGMTAAERTAYFRSHSSVAAIRESAKQKNPPEKSFVLREEPPKPQSSRE